MNCVVLVTKSNLASLIELAEQIETKQKKPVVGALVVVKPTSIHVDLVNRIVSGIGKFFEVKEVVSAQVGQSLRDESQIAGLLALFLLRRYHFYPGPWLVIDSPCGVRLDNPLTVMEQVHRLGNAMNCGRCVTSLGGRVPVGPVVINFPVQSVKQLFKPSGENWRSRARYMFGRSTWNQILPDSYPFTITADQGGEQAKILKNAATELGRAAVEAPQLPVPSGVSVTDKVDIIVNQPEVFPNLAPDVEVEEEIAKVVDVPDFDYDSMSDDELRQLYVIRVKRKPHPSISRERMIESCKKHDFRE